MTLDQAVAKAEQEKLTIRERAANIGKGAGYVLGGVILGTASGLYGVDLAQNILDIEPWSKIPLEGLTALAGVGLSLSSIYVGVRKILGKTAYEGSKN